jgi:hypothetical protein
MTPRAARRLDEIYGFESGASLAVAGLIASETDVADDERSHLSAPIVLANSSRLGAERGGGETQTSMASRL